jgi:hypothetical protein
MTTTEQTIEIGPLSIYQPEWREADDPHPWTVSGDLRNYETQWEVTNHEITERIEEILHERGLVCGRDRDYTSDSEMACTFFYTTTEALAREIAEIAVKVKAEWVPDSLTVREEAEALDDSALMAQLDVLANKSDDLREEEATWLGMLLHRAVARGLVSL